MQHTNQWAQNKQPLVAAFAQVMAFMGEDFYEILEDVKLENISPQKLPYPSIDKWLKYYKNSRQNFEFYSEVFFGNKRYISALRSELSKKNLFLEFTGNEKKNFLKKARRLTADEQKNYIVLKRENSQELQKKTASFLSQEIADGNEEFFREIKAKVASTFEMSFLARVWVPCLYFFGKSPSQLLRNARNGNLEDLEALIRVDDSVIFDHKISSRLHNLRNTSPRKYRDLMECIFKRPKVPLSKQKTKCFLAGIIWIFSKAANLPLREPEIRELFDAVHKDKGLGEIDTDLPDSPHAFYMAMQREMRIFFPSS